MTMRKLLLLLIVGIFLFSLASSAEINDYGKVKQGECIEVRQVCASCTYVNVSVAYPNQTMAITNVEMSNQGGGLWIYEFCNTSNLGRYDVAGSGDLEGTATGFDVLYFEVTATGGSGMMFWTILIYSLAVIFLFSSMIVREEIFVYLSGVLFLIAGVIMMIYGLDVLNDWTTRAISYVSLGLGMLFTLGAYIYNSYSNSEYEEEY
jgi:hypothetical protein